MCPFHYDRQATAEQLKTVRTRRGEVKNWKYVEGRENRKNFTNAGRENNNNNERSSSLKI